MAHWTSYDKSHLKGFWTVDMAVGRACPNHYWDTYLVTFFLEKITRSPQYPDTFAPMGPIKVGGRWENSLFVAITQVQLFLKSAYIPGPDGLKPDVNGRVDPEQPMRAPIKNSTIIYLNWCTKLLYPHMYDNLLGAHEVPSELRNNLRISMMQAHPAEQ